MADEPKKQKRRRRRGRGHVYRRGNVYWIQFYFRGKKHAESARTRYYAEAEEFLTKRLSEIDRGRGPGVVYEKTTFADLKEFLLADYRDNKKKSLGRAEQSVRHLEKFFGQSMATEIDTARILEYRDRRLSMGMKNGTINRELAALQRMLKLGWQYGKVEAVPFIPKLKESPPRSGFFEAAEFEALKEALPDHLKGVATFAYRTGWRISEVTGLTWKHINRQERSASLNAGETKNNAGRTAYLDEELKQVIDRQWSNRIRQGKIVPDEEDYVFLNRLGTGKLGRFDKAWKTACKKAGIPDALFHDLRRNAVRNLSRAGVPDTIAMKITGHKTRSVFDRYNIGNDADLREAAQKLEAYHDSKRQVNHTLTTIVEFPAESHPKSESR